MLWECEDTSLLLLQVALTLTDSALEPVAF